MQYYEADPLYIPNLASILLSHLSTLPSSNALEPSSLINLEMRESTSSDMQESHAPEEDSSYPRILFKHPILPWIWDFDAVPAKEQQNKDWDHLIKQLSSIEIVDPPNVIADLPLGLRNQRRIWALIDDMLSLKEEDVV